jgi:septum formation topological specificity factor MinE
MLLSGGKTGVTMTDILKNKDDKEEIEHMKRAEEVKQVANVKKSLTAIIKSVYKDIPDSAIYITAEYNNRMSIYEFNIKLEDPRSNNFKFRNDIKDKMYSIFGDAHLGVTSGSHIKENTFFQVNGEIPELLSKIQKRSPDTLIKPEALVVVMSTDKKDIGMVG